MNKVWLILISFLIFTALLVFAANKYLWVSLVINNKDTRAVSFKPNKFISEVYISFLLRPRITGIYVTDFQGQKTKIYPKTIAVFTTDKMRVGNPEVSVGKPVLASAITNEKEKIALLYIWADDSVYKKPNPTKSIVNYIYKSIKFYQDDN